jgi:eukaryotic-like serine/threonine-protein kinase
MSEDLFKDRYLTQRIVVERDYVTRAIAIDRILSREVMITQLNGRVGRRAAVQDRFRTAARDAVRLSHSNVIALYDIGSSNGFPYSVQEHTHSEPLSHIIDHEGPFHADDVAVLVEQVAAALDYAHVRNIPHLALSPEVITVDYDGQVLVSDFGIGRVLSQLAPTDVAKLRYQAPEQVGEEQGDSRSDIFALGVIAYEMLTGISPFDVTSTDTIRAALAECTPRRLFEVNPDVPQQVSDIVLNALSKNPAQRYRTAGHLGEALTAWRDQGQGRQYDFLDASTAPFETTASMPLHSHPVRAQDAATTGDESGPTRRATAIAAWLAIGVGLFALIWIAVTLIDDRGDSDPGVADASPALSITSTATAASAPTAVSLVGMTLDGASEATDMEVRVAATETSDSVPAGQIIRQSPNPGSPVRSGELIVVLSAGPAAQPIQLSDVPIAGVPFDQLAQQLTALGLNVTQIQEGSETVAEGAVIRIDEQSAMPGETVHVMVSMGNKVQIPADLQSQPIDDAVDRLEEAGLTVGEPIGVSRDRIESFDVDLDEFQIVDGDLVGIQEDGAGFGLWVERGSLVTPVYYDAALDQ